MRKIDYLSFPGTLLTPEISNLLSIIHEYRGKHELYVTARKDILKTLLDVAIIQSTDSSNRIEGIFTSDIRLKELVMQVYYNYRYYSSNLGRWINRNPIEEEDTASLISFVNNSAISYTNKNGLCGWQQAFGGYESAAAHALAIDDLRRKTRTCPKNAKIRDIGSGFFHDDHCLRKQNRDYVGRWLGGIHFNESRHGRRSDSTR